MPVYGNTPPIIRYQTRAARRSLRRQSTPLAPLTSPERWTCNTPPPLTERQQLSNQVEGKFWRPGSNSFASPAADAKPCLAKVFVSPPRGATAFALHRATTTRVIENLKTQYWYLKSDRVRPKSKALSLLQAPFFLTQAFKFLTMGVGGVLSCPNNGRTISPCVLVHPIRLPCVSLLAWGCLVLPEHPSTRVIENLKTQYWCFKSDQAS